MTFAAFSSTKSAASLQSSWLYRFARALDGMLSVLVNRWLARDLHDLTDHELDDIGLTRADLVRATEQPLLSDPTRYLGEVAQSSPMTVTKRSDAIWAREFPPAVRGRIE